MSAFTLRIIALAAMLLDHLGFATEYMPLRILGRIAFPIFLYLICNGYRHTSSPLRYGLRLGLFALISQVPFSLMCYQRISFENWNVFVTLLLALVCIWFADRMLARKTLRWFALLPALAVMVLYHFGWIQSDYGARGILTAMVVFLLERFGTERTLAVTVGIVVGIVYYLLVQWLQEGSLSQWAWIQLFSLFAIPLLTCYNGEKGGSWLNTGGKKLAQWGGYLFYPVHMLLIWQLIELLNYK